jgi:hypothetical protein
LLGGSYPSSGTNDGSLQWGPQAMRGPVILLGSKPIGNR